MKLSAFARIAKKAHTVGVFTKPVSEEYEQTGQREMILTNGIALYRCGCIPEVFGDYQICALLDITKKQREKVIIEEKNYSDISTVAGLNLSDGEIPGEEDTQEVKIGVTYNGKQFTALKCGDGEMIFFNSELLSPLREETGSPYFKIRSRIADNNGKRFRYLIAKDGFTTLAAFMPIIALTDEFMKDLNAFVEDCTMQKQIEDNRIAECREAKSK